MIGSYNISYLELLKISKAKIVFFDEPEDKGRQLVIRHDVDQELDKALKIAEFEKAHGISSIYFLLHTALYFDYTKTFLKKCERFLDLGHQIGFHNDAVTVWSYTLEPVLNIVNKPLQFLRDAGFQIDFSAAHGSPEAISLRFRNFELWEEYEKEPLLNNPQISLKDVNLKNEVYFMPFDFYLSDSGGKWLGGKLNGCRSWFEWDLPHLKQQEIYKQMDEFAHSKKSKLQLLTHPKWWIL